MNMRESPIPMPIRTTVNGRVWRLFGLAYDTADGPFSTYFYALSFEHASHIVEEIKATARLDGQLDSWCPASEV